MCCRVPSYVLATCGVSVPRPRLPGPVKKATPDEKKSSTPPSIAIQKGPKNIRPKKKAHPRVGTVQKSSPRGRKGAAPRPVPLSKKVAEKDTPQKQKSDSRYRPKNLPSPPLPSRGKKRAAPRPAPRPKKLPKIRPKKIRHTSQPVPFKNPSLPPSRARKRAACRPAAPPVKQGRQKKNTPWKRHTTLSGPPKKVTPGSEQEQHPAQHRTSQSSQRKFAKKKATPHSRGPPQKAPPPPPFPSPPLSRGKNSGALRPAPHTQFGPEIRSPPPHQKKSTPHCRDLPKKTLHVRKGAARRPAPHPKTALHKKYLTVDATVCLKAIPRRHPDCI